MRKMREGKMFTAGNILLAVCLMFLYISCSVTAVLHFRPLYYWDIEHLHIVETSGYDEEVIRANYDCLIDYNSLLNREELVFPDFCMSEGGRIHFEEVKRIFDGFQLMFLADLIVCIIWVCRRAQKKSFQYLKLAGVLTIAVPAVLGGLIASNWNWFFVKFHEVVFRNDYWIFDYVTDPVINILPDRFFMHCAIGILLMTVFLAVCSIIAGAVLTKKR